MPDSAVLPTPQPAQNSFAGRFLHHPAAFVGVVIVAALCLLAIFAPLVTRVPPGALDMSNRLAFPSMGALMGTDSYGRDVFTRLAYGGQITLLVAVGSVALGTIIGVFAGLLAGYFGGRLDAVLMRIIEILLSFPSLILALGIMAIVGPGVTSVILAVGITSAPMIARVVRSTVLSLKELAFVEAAVALGGTHYRIILRHLLPNVAGAVAILSALNLGSAILVESSLSFLGLGPGPDVPSWGSMISDGTKYLRRNPWPAIFPGMAITLTILGFNLVGDGLRDLLDPRIQKLIK
jgi:peptide/nickel transport system permease protein